MGGVDRRFQKAIYNQYEHKRVWFSLAFAWISGGIVCRREIGGGVAKGVGDDLWGAFSLGSFESE